jgi:alpha-methylacyl-CoA racemase
VYGRITGWGQTGPLSQTAGHDINYIARSGAMWYSGEAEGAPLPPPTLVGDLGGGALYLALGLVSGILHARTSGAGQVVDAAVVDGSAHLMNLLLSLHAAGSMPIPRGGGLLDGPWWYGCYRCADGRYLSIGALEPQFRAELLQRLGAADDEAFARPYDPRTWPAGRMHMAAIIAGHTRDEWCKVFDRSEACVAPVFDPLEAAQDEHLRARGTYVESGGIRQAVPAPRFSGFALREVPTVPARGADWQAIMVEAGFGSLSPDDARAMGIVPA